MRSALQAYFEAAAYDKINASARRKHFAHVYFKAACPACGQECGWTSYLDPMGISNVRPSSATVPMCICVRGRLP